MRALALSLLLVHSVQAQGDLESAALVVGIDNYTGVALDPESNRGRKELSQGALPDPPKLTNAAADARRFANFLLVRYGIKAQLLPQDKATARGILAALNALVSRVRPGGRAIFYFAGHGTRIANGSRGGELDEALVPADASRGAYPIRDVELGLIYRKAIGKKIQLTVILDSCFSGGMARGEDEAVRAFQDLEPRSVDDPTARFDVSSPLFGHLAAARAGRRALDGRGSGRSFTEVLLDALSRTPHELTLAEAAAITSQLVGRQGPEAEGGARGVVNIVG